jgi:hypothetical protein
MVGQVPTETYHRRAIVFKRRLALQLIESHRPPPRGRGEMVTDAQTSIPRDMSHEVQSAFKDWMIHEECRSHYVSQFAAFFIVARAKRSIVKSCLND